MLKNLKVTPSYYYFIILILSNINLKRYNIFWKQTSNSFMLLFGDLSSYQAFWHRMQLYFQSLKFYYQTLKLKGLGLRVREYSNNFFKFRLTFNTYIYFHVPKDIIIKRKRRNLLFISKNLQKMNTIITQIIFLLKLDLYTKKNYFNKRHRIIFLKPKTVRDGN